MEKSLEGVLVLESGTKRQQVLFDDQSGLILNVGDLGIPKEKIDYFFNEDCLVFSGMGDVHIHAREDVSGENCYKEDFLTASKAAINGGVIHICDMPNNPCPPVDDESYKEKFKLTKKGLIPIFLYAGIGPKTKPLKVKVPYKVYMCHSVGDLFFNNRKQLNDSLSLYEGEWVSFHCEDPEILEKFKNEESHFKRRPRSAEVMATKTALELIEEYNLKGKLCHYSVAEGLPLIREAKKKGLPVTMEVTPQHIYFNDEELSEKEKHTLQMNPPIRLKEDKDELLKALLAGEIDFLATDHAPHTSEEKEKGISGLTGLDTFGAFVTWLIVEKGCDPVQAAKFCSQNPGKFVNEFIPTLAQYDDRFKDLGKGFGIIQKDYLANFTVLNLNKPTKITKEVLKTKVGHSPFEGVTFPGRVEAAFLKGTPFNIL